MIDLLCSFATYVVQNSGQTVRMRPLSLLLLLLPSLLLLISLLGPDFISEGPIAIKAGLSVDKAFSLLSFAVFLGRHPILETIRKENFIAVREPSELSFFLALIFFFPFKNDTFLDASNNFIMLSGPNMSGKSTYLKQVALLTIVAHLGNLKNEEAALTLLLFSSLIRFVCSCELRLVPYRR